MIGFKKMSQNNTASLRTLQECQQSPADLNTTTNNDIKNEIIRLLASDQFIEAKRLYERSK